MPDPLWFVFGPGAGAMITALVTPIGLAVHAGFRRRAARRNRGGRCAHCDVDLLADPEAGLYLVEAHFICAGCATRLRKRLWVLVPVLGTMAVVAAVSATYGAIAGRPGVDWYLNSRLIPLLLPTGGLALGLLGSIRLMKRLNHRALESGDRGTPRPLASAWPRQSLPGAGAAGPSTDCRGPLEMWWWREPARVGSG